MNTTSTRTVCDDELSFAAELEPPRRDEHEHHARLWVAKHRDAHPSEATAAFEHVLGAIWSRASVPLGEMPLSTVFGAVLRRARVRHAWMHGFSIVPSGIRYERPPQVVVAGDDLFAAAHFTLVELMRTLGKCTAEILTPHLHAELARTHHLPRRLRGE